MGKRGRKSAASLTIVKDREIQESVDRPAPPPDLTPEQVEVWYQVVDSLASDYFKPDTFPLLEQYCRHTVRARHYAQLIDKMQKKGNPDADDIRAYRDLTRSEEEQTRALASLATKMRLSQQSTYDRQKAKGRKAGKAPWND